MARDLSTGRWSGLTLQLFRNSNGTAEWTIVHRLQSGTKRWDRKLMWGRLECSPGSPVSQDPLVALLEALKAAGATPAGQGEPTPALPPQGSAPPGGTRGDSL